LSDLRASGGDTTSAQVAYDDAAARYDTAVTHGATRFIASWARMPTHGQRVAAGAVARGAG
jgi:hypothetical protein